MPFSYDDGSGTPNLHGSIEVGSISINDGTFVLTAAPGLLQGTPGLRRAVSELSNAHGGYPGTPYYNPREFTIEGYLDVPSTDYFADAEELLYATFNLADTSLKLLTLDKPGWSGTRQVLARINGEIDLITPADPSAALLPRRLFSIPLIAPDPLIYSTTEQTVTVPSTGPDTTITNNGNMPSPFKVRFNSARTNPVLIGPGLTGFQIAYGADITSGYVEYNTNPATETGVYCHQGAGATSLMENVTDDSATVIPVGASAWASSSDAGTGDIVVYFRDAWSNA